MHDKVKKALLYILTIFPSKLRVIVLRGLGAEIGKGAHIGVGSLVVFTSNLNIGNHVRIGSGSALICHSAVIGSYTELASASIIKVPKIRIGRDCKISHGAIIRSGHTTMQSELIIGDLVHVFPFVMIDCSRKVEIQDEAGIGPRCSIFTHSSYKSVLEGYSITYGDVFIGKRVELSYNVFVAPGVNICDDAICAYGSYVNKNVDSGVLVAGMPAKIKRTRDQLIENLGEDDIVSQLDSIVKDYRENVTITTGTPPLDIYIAKGEMNVKISPMKAYILVDSSLQISSEERYAVFNVTTKTTYNRDLDCRDYLGLRKYLSRYGIRFISEDFI